MCHNTHASPAKRRVMPLLAVAFMTALTLISSASHSAFAKSLQAAGTRVVIDLPDGFEPATRFLGFEHQSGASIVILEVPGFAFQRMKGAMTAKMLATRGVVDVAPLPLGGGDPRVALTGRQGTPIGWFQKVMLLIGDPNTTALITANVPQTAIDAGTVSLDAIKEAVKSTSLATTKAPRPQRFSIRDHAPLKFAGNFAGDAQLFNETGTLPRERITKVGTTFIVAGSIDNRAAQGEPETVAMRLLQSLRDLERLTVSQNTSIKIDGLDGIAQTARADYVAAGAAPQPIVIYHVVLFEPAGGYIRMIGQAPLATGRAALDDFKRMAASFQRTQR